MGVLQEKPMQIEDFLAMQWKIPGIIWDFSAEIPLKSKYNLSHCHTEAPHLLLFPQQGLVSGPLFPSSMWRMEAKQGLLIAG